MKKLLIMIFFLAISSLGFSREFAIHSGVLDGANLRENLILIQGYWQN